MDGRVAAGHEEERAVLRAVLRAGDRGLEGVRPALAQRRLHAAGRVRAHRRALEVAEARAHGAEEAVLGEDEPLDRGRVGDAGHHDVRVLGQLEGRARELRAPSFTSGSQRSGVRFQTVSGNPFFRRLRAMRLPMRPSPAKPIRLLMSRSPRCASFRRHRRHGGLLRTRGYVYPSTAPGVKSALFRPPPRAPRRCAGRCRGTGTGRRPCRWASPGTRGGGWPRRRRGCAPPSRAASSAVGRRPATSPDSRKRSSTRSGSRPVVFRCARA